MRASVPGRTAARFIVLIGVVSLFADATYEAARSVTGQFLALLGASATVVGIVAGFGELIGYAVRLVSGYLGDRTRRYWPITLWGYALNMLAVPLLALAGRWETAAGLIVAERLGIALWGIGMGVQESVVRAAIASMIPADRRGTAYGAFNAVYGLAWFAGSALMGVLYDVSLAWLVAFSVVGQLAAVPILFALRSGLRAEMPQ